MKHDSPSRGLLIGVILGSLLWLVCVAAIRNTGVRVDTMTVEAEAR